MEVVLDSGRLFITGFLNANRIELIPQSETPFTSGEGLSYEFVKDAGGAVTHVVEIQVSDNYPYQRRRPRAGCELCKVSIVGSNRAATGSAALAGFHTT